METDSTMSEQEENDIIISIGGALLRAMEKGAEFSIHFGTIELFSKLPEGSVAKYFEQAAADVGAEVVRKGARSALLRKQS